MDEVTLPQTPTPISPVQPDIQPLSPQPISQISTESSLPTPVPTQSFPTPPVQQSPLPPLPTTIMETKKKNPIGIILLIIVVIGLVGAAVYFYLLTKPLSVPPRKTTEATQTPTPTPTPLLSSITIGYEENKDPSSYFYDVQYDATGKIIKSTPYAEAHPYEYTTYTKAGVQTEQSTLSADKKYRLLVTDAVVKIAPMTNPTSFTEIGTADTKKGYNMAADFITNTEVMVVVQQVLSPNSGNVKIISEKIYSTTTGKTYDVPMYNKQPLEVLIAFNDNTLVLGDEIYGEASVYGFIDKTSWTYTYRKLGATETTETLATSPIIKKQLVNYQLRQAPANKLKVTMVDIAKGTVTDIATIDGLVEPTQDKTNSEATDALMYSLTFDNTESNLYTSILRYRSAPGEVNGDRQTKQLVTYLVSLSGNNAVTPVITKPEMTPFFFDVDHTWISGSKTALYLESSDSFSLANFEIATEPTIKKVKLDLDSLPKGIGVEKQNILREINGKSL